MPRFQKRHITFPFKQILTNGTGHIILLPRFAAVLLHRAAPAVWRHQRSFPTTASAVAFVPDSRCGCRPLRSRLLSGVPAQIPGLHGENDLRLRSWRLRMPWATSSPPNPMRISAAFAVCWCICSSGLRMLGKTHGRWRLTGSMI